MFKIGSLARSENFSMRNITVANVRTRFLFGCCFAHFATSSHCSLFGKRNFSQRPQRPHRVFSANSASSARKKIKMANTVARHSRLLTMAWKSIRRVGCLKHTASGSVECRMQSGEWLGMSDYEYPQTDFAVAVFCAGDADAQLLDLVRTRVRDGERPPPTNPRRLHQLPRSAPETNGTVEGICSNLRIQFPLTG